MRMDFNMILEDKNLKNLLVVVDFQNDFVNGSLGFKEAQTIEGEIIKKVQSYQRNGDDIIFTLDTHFDDYLETIEGKNLPIKHCIKGTYGHEIYGKLKEISKQFKKIEKYTFGSLELGNLIKDKNYKNIELVGLVSNICVFSNAIIAKSSSPNSNIFVDTIAVASPDTKMQEYAFKLLQNLHIKVY